MIRFQLALRKLRNWWFEYRTGLPHPRSINSFMIEKEYLRELAKMHQAGFNLAQIAFLVKQMKCPEAPTLTRKDGSTYKKLWIAEKQFYGQELTRERLRQLIWKIWRLQHVDRKLRKTSQVHDGPKFTVRN